MYVGAQLAEALEMKDRIFLKVEEFFTSYDLLLSAVRADLSVRQPANLDW